MGGRASWLLTSRRVFVDLRFKEYINRFTIDQLRLYLYSLFTALHHMHRHAVIHRDVKVSPLCSPSPAPTHEYLILLYFLAAITAQQFSVLD